MSNTARSLQMVLGAIFVTLGSWVLLFPGIVEQLALNPDYVIGSITSRVLIGCFGAQAILCGVVILSARFTARTFLIFGVIGSVPFFVFNYYFVFVVPVFSEWMLLDVLGNVGILTCGLWGWRVMSVAEQGQT